MFNSQYSTPAEALIGRVVGEDFIKAINTPLPEWRSTPAANVVVAQQRLIQAAGADPDLLRALESIDLSGENVHLRKLIDRTLRQLTPTDLEQAAKLNLPLDPSDPTSFIRTYINTTPENWARILFAQREDVKYSDDQRRIAIDLKDYSLSARICFLIDGLGDDYHPNTSIAIESNQRFIHAMYPGARRTNLLFAWINNQPHESLPEILKSIGTFDKWMRENPEINDTLGTSPKTTFLCRLREHYPSCLDAFKDLVAPYL
jgi:hypothetical protein